MPTLDESLQLALAHHQAGRLSDAEPIYRQILQVDPRHAEAWHYLGLLAHQVGQNNVAVDYLRQAIALDARQPVFHCNLGTALMALGQHDLALASFQRCLELKPDFSQALYNRANLWRTLGRLEEAAEGFQAAHRAAPADNDTLMNWGAALYQLGRFADAAHVYRELARRQPESAEVANNLGGIYMALGQNTAAIESYRHSLRLKPENAEAHNNLGNLVASEGATDEAIEHYRTAVRLRTDFPEAHNNLGVALLDREQFDEAETCFRTAAQLRPTYIEALNNLAMLLQVAGRYDQALAEALEILRQQPDNAAAYNVWGLVRRKQGRFAEAIASYDRAIELQPGFADAHFNRAMARLTIGQFAESWSDYEWRWHRKGMSPRQFDAPRWDGSSFAGRTLLVYFEQGLGDTVQFCRYLEAVKQRGGTLIVECQQEAVKLLSRYSAIDRLVIWGDPLLAHDIQFPLLSLPGLFGTHVDTIPNRVPYLTPDPALVEHWRQELASVKGLKVGIAWQSNRRHVQLRYRSIPVAQFAPLSRLPGVRLFSLQKEHGAEQLASRADAFPIVDLSARLHDLHDTAAVMRALDLVITCDTSVAHLAGAVAVPVWTALAHSCDWRWLTERSDCPWYPTMELFRQPSPGDWASVFAQLTKRLAERARRLSPS